MGQVMKNKIKVLVLIGIFIFHAIVFSEEMPSYTDFINIIKREKINDEMGSIGNRALGIIERLCGDKTELASYIEDDRFANTLDNYINIRQLFIGDMSGGVFYTSYFFYPDNNDVPSKEKCIEMPQIFFDEFNSLMGLSFRNGDFSADFSKTTFRVFLVTRKIGSKIERNVFINPDLLIALNRKLLTSGSERNIKYYFKAYNFVVALGVLYDMGYYDVTEHLMPNSSLLLKNFFDSDYDPIKYLMNYNKPSVKK